jgi:hypothetical protein
MNLEIIRDTFTDRSTIGELHVNGVFECYTLEDHYPTGAYVKTPGLTAIPEGTYRVLYTHSPKFGRLMPLIDGVPGYTGVRLHAGTIPEHTEGCPLVGRKRGLDQISESIRAFDRIDGMIAYATRIKEPITITVRRAGTVTDKRT